MSSSSMTIPRETRLNGELQLLKSRRVAQALTAPRTSRRERSRMRLLHTLRYTRMTAVPKTPLSPRVPLKSMIRRMTRRTGILDTGSNRPSARSLPLAKSLISSSTATAQKTQTELKFRTYVHELAFWSFLSLQGEGAPSQFISIRSRSACPDVKQNFFNFQDIYISIDSSLC